MTRLRWMVWMGALALAAAWGDAERVWRDGVIYLVEDPVVDGVMHEEAESELTVFFLDGSVIRYGGVRREQFERLMQSREKSVFLFGEIRSGCPAVEMAGPFRRIESVREEATNPEGEETWPR